MPLTWKKGRNPYIYNYFGILSIGPNASIAQVVALAQQLKIRIDGGALVELNGVRIDKNQVDKACSSLQDEKTWAHELLLVHSQVKHKKMQLESLLKKLEETVKLSIEYEPLRLVHPFAIFWFIPEPGSEAAPLPEFENFGLVGPNDEADRKLDIVFDS